MEEERFDGNGSGSEKIAETDSNILRISVQSRKIQIPSVPLSKCWCQKARVGIMDHLRNRERTFVLICFTVVWGTNQSQPADML